MWLISPVGASAEDRLKHARWFDVDVDDYAFPKSFYYHTDVETGDGARARHRSPLTTPGFAGDTLLSGKGNGVLLLQLQYGLLDYRVQRNDVDPVQLKRIA